MEILFNTKHHSLDIKCYEPTYALINTSDYLRIECGKTRNDSSVIIAKHSELEDYGWGDDIEIEVGEQMISNDNGIGTLLIRLS